MTSTGAGRDLAEYRRKRDFSRTPEPRGDAPPAGGDGARGGRSPGRSAPRFAGWDRLPEGRRFCVQMHRARRLHFDLRLEHAGVLLSWAVPKGPTLDPEVKRLAVHVEDHPIDYGDFEGVIPEGYGAGTVLLWDAGTVEWTRESAADVDASLARGDLKFALNGSKLRGEFALVRLGGRGRRAATEEDGDAWLLIKKRDDAAVAGMEAVDLEVSVKTGRNLAEIAAGSPPRRERSDAAGAPEQAAGDLDGLLEAAPVEQLPRRLSPMLASPLDAPFSREGWLFEMKYDGVRALVGVEDGRVEARGRRGRDETARYPEILDLAAALGGHSALVDGEVVALDEGGRPSFERLQQRINVGDRRAAQTARQSVPAVLMVFDLLHLDGHDLRSLPLVDRKRLLRAVLADVDTVHYADHVEREGEAFFDAVRTAGVEGMVAKAATSTYQPGRRTTSWLKVKSWRQQECVVCGYTAGRGGRGALGALVLGILEGGRLVHAGQVGSGLDERTLRTLRERLDALATDRCPLDPPPRTDQEAVWVRPEVVCTVRYTEWTTAGTLRHPVYRGLREDLGPEDCVREVPLDVSSVVAGAGADGRVVTAPASRSRRRGAARSEAPPPPPVTPGAPPPSHPRTPAEVRRALDDPGLHDAVERLTAMRGDGPLEVLGRTVRVTNLDKPYWPDDGITKRDMIAYYLAMSPLLVPHLRERPLGTQVFPDGIAGKSFWRKRIPEHAPAWMRSWTYHGDRTVTYILVDEPATLVWVANAGVIDLHPWHSRIDAPTRPDWAVFDLDPFPPATFADVLQVGRLVRAALDHYGLSGYPKLSGQTGLQVHVPITRGPEYESVRRWVEEVGRTVGRVLPDLVSWEWTVARRAGRLRIDYTQNVLGKTLAAPYSLRPAPHAPVAMPVTWEELDDPGVRPDRFTIADAASRVRSVGDLFAPVVDGGQVLPG